MATNWQPHGELDTFFSMLVLNSPNTDGFNANLHGAYTCTHIQVDIYSSNLWKDRLPFVPFLDLDICGNLSQFWGCLFMFASEPFLYHHKCCISIDEINQWTKGYIQNFQSNPWFILGLCLLDLFIVGVRTFFFLCAMGLEDHLTSVRVILQKRVRSPLMNHGSFTIFGPRHIMSYMFVSTDSSPVVHYRNRNISLGFIRFQRHPYIIQIWW